MWKNRTESANIFTATYFHSAVAACEQQGSTWRDDLTGARPQNRLQAYCFLGKFDLEITLVVHLLGLLLHCFDHNWALSSYGTKGALFMEAFYIHGTLCI